MEQELRYWTIDNPDGSVPNDGDGVPMEPLVDEVAGGIVGFLTTEVADEIVNRLNGRSEA